MIYVECPGLRPDYYNLSVFLAGSITGASDWQSAVVSKLDRIAHDDFLILNPRRKEFDITVLAASELQIAWEFHMLEKADAILFWFAEGAMSPITMYELGRATLMKKPIFVGVEPGFYREFDVRMQLSLALPEVQVVRTLDHLVSEVGEWLKGRSNQSSV